MTTDHNLTTVFVALNGPWCAQLKALELFEQFVSNIIRTKDPNAEAYQLLLVMWQQQMRTTSRILKISPSEAADVGTYKGSET